MAVSARWGYRESKQLTRGCHLYPRYLVRCGPSSLSRMQLNLHATRRMRHGASRFVTASLVRRKLVVLRPGFVGSRGQRSHDHGMQNHEHAPLPRKISPRVNFRNVEVSAPIFLHSNTYICDGWQHSDYPAPRREGIPAPSVG